MDLKRENFSGEKDRGGLIERGPVPEPEGISERTFCTVWPTCLLSVGLRNSRHECWLSFHDWNVSKDLRI